MRVAIIITILAAAPVAHAQTAGLFANRNFDIRFTETQFTDDPERPVIAQNRRTQIQVGFAAAATRITRNWDKPPPGLEHLDASGQLGQWVSLQNRAHLRHQVEASRLVQTIMTSSFVTRMTIELDRAGCKVRLDHALNPGEKYYRMRNIALGTPMQIRDIRTEANPTCALAEDVLW